MLWSEDWSTILMCVSARAFACVYAGAYACIFTTDLTEIFFVSDICPQNHTALRGRIQSPGYPGYRNNVYCEIRVQPLVRAERLFLYAEVFDLEEDHDFLLTASHETVRLKQQHTYNGTNMSAWVGECMGTWVHQCVSGWVSAWVGECLCLCLKMQLLNGLRVWLLTFRQLFLKLPIVVLIVSKLFTAQF